MGRQHISFPLLKQQDWKTTTLNNLHGRSTQQFTRRARQAKTRRKTLKKDNGSVFSYSSKTGRTRRKTETNSPRSHLFYRLLLLTTRKARTRRNTKSNSPDNNNLTRSQLRLHLPIGRRKRIRPARTYPIMSTLTKDNGFNTILEDGRQKRIRPTCTYFIDYTKSKNKTENKNEFARHHELDLLTPTLAPTYWKRKTNSPRLHPW